MHWSILHEFYLPCCCEGGNFDQTAKVHINLFEKRKPRRLPKNNLTKTKQTNKKTNKLNGMTEL